MGGSRAKHSCCGLDNGHCRRGILVFGYSAVASVVLGILGLVWTDKAKKEGYTGDKRTIAFVLSLVGLIGGLVVLIITVILINVLAVPGITALRDMLGMIGEMANEI